LQNNAIYKAMYGILKHTNKRHNVTYIKSYVHDNAASEENLVNIYIQYLQNMHIYMTTIVQMAPNKTTGHSN